MDDVIKEIRYLDEAVVVTPAGELTFERSPEFHKALVEVCEKNPGKLIVNLREVTQVDSSAVGTLVEIFRRVKKNSGQMHLVGMTTLVRGVFEITKLDQFFSILETEQEALES